MLTPLAHIYLVSLKRLVVSGQCNYLVKGSVAVNEAKSKSFDVELQVLKVEKAHVPTADVGFHIRATQDYVDFLGIRR